MEIFKKISEAVLKTDQESIVFETNKLIEDVVESLKDEYVPELIVKIEVYKWNNE
jgi:hypothetical protein